MDVKPSRLVVDTNVLIDIADEVDEVLTAIDIISLRLPAAEQLVTPVVLDELAFLADFGQTASLRASAGTVFDLLRNKSRFRPILELPFASEQAELLAREFRHRKLLPAGEIHDSLILAESILLDCNILLTSDEHLRSIDHQQLIGLLNQHDLTAPVIAPLEQLFVNSSGSDI